MNIFLMIFLVAVGQLTGCKSVSNGKLTENKDTGGGNTGDLRARERRLAWFTGKSTLKYCIKMGEDVSSPLAPQLDKTFQQAFQAWMPIVSQVNQRLAETNGKVLPTSLQRQSGCAGADLVVGFGSQWSEEDVGIRDVIDGSRESNLSAGYSLPQTQSMLLWIAGTAEAPAAQGLGASTFAKNIDYANMNDVSVTLRYTIGRMLGNVDIPGTIMAFLPERWIACANAEDPTCVRVVNTNIVEDQFQILGESTKPIKGCVGGALPAEFTNAQKNLSLSAADTTLMTAQWIGTPSTASIQKIEVFAIDDVKRFFFEQKIISGFAIVNNSKKYMRIYFNETASPVRLNLRCADGKELTIFEATTRCTGTAEAVKELIDRC